MLALYSILLQDLIKRYRITSTLEVFPNIVLVELLV